MQNNQILLWKSCPSSVLVCVNRVEDGDPSGEIYSLYRNGTVLFHGVVELISRMDRLYDRIGFPQAFQQFRSFYTQEPAPAVIDKLEVIAPMEQMEQDVFELKTGDKATFVIQVQFRQNSSWQGVITWTEQKKTRRFRSAMEMIKLMDSALSPAHDDPESDWE